MANSFVAEVTFQETFGFLTFSGYMEMKHWAKMG